MTLAGRLAIVTGASRGIGRAIADAFAGAGARLALCARDEVALGRAIDELRAKHPGLGAHGIRCNLAHADEIAAFASRVVEELGVPDVVVHNAGIVERARLDDASEAAWDQVLAVNLRGPALLTRALLPAMRARRSGRILFIGSISGTLGTPGLAAYCASKHGVVGLARALAAELRDEGIQVNVLNPGSVDTEMLAGSGFPPRMSADEVAGVALYLAAGAPAPLTGSSVDLFG